MEINRENLKPTSDPFTFIIEQREGYIKYCLIQEDEVKRVWEVHGVCTGIGNCFKGTNDSKPELDCPVYFLKDCCPLETVLLYGN